MAIKVVDAIMSTGKTSAAITYMNEHKDDKFVFITPYLAESERIKKSCPDLHFVEPSNKLKRYDFKKGAHTAALIREGANIATTHQAFKGYTPDMLDDIREHGYTLIVDENVDVLEEFDFHPADLQLAVDAGYIKEENGIYSIVRDDYEGKALAGLFTLLRSRELIRVKDHNQNVLFYWTLPPTLLTSFKDVFILTYLFEGQSLHHLMKIYDIPYEYIGIEHTNASEYRFGEYPGYVPEYVHHLKDMVHILDYGRLNEIGDDYYSLSMNWFKRNEDGVGQLRRNVYNVFNNILGDIPADKRLWGAHNSEYNVIKGKGYTKSFLTFNAKATNNYRDRISLVYLANVFMNVGEKNFYKVHGIEVDDDMYALSIMVQWIWRSAIRDGQEVYLYIPSKRMRTLLIDWLNNIDRGGAEYEKEAV